MLARPFQQILRSSPYDDEVDESGEHGDNPTTATRLRSYDDGSRAGRDRIARRELPYYQVGPA